MNECLFLQRVTIALGDECPKDVSIEEMYGLPRIVFRETRNGRTFEDS